MEEKLDCGREAVLECCLESVESAKQASLGGAHRVELCANLAQGGVTPSIGDIKTSVSALAGSATRVHVLIRPRPGDLVYSALEKQAMVQDVKAAVTAGAHGIVIGALLESGDIDEETTTTLVAAANRSCSVTFHRAFDCCTTEPVAALETLIRLGVDRVLTSGRAGSAWEGRDTIARLVEAGRGRITVMPGAGITQHNVKQLMVNTGAREVHVGSGCQEAVPHNGRKESSVNLGASGGGPGDVIMRVSADRVSSVLVAMRTSTTAGS